MSAKAWAAAALAVTLINPGNVAAVVAIPGGGKTRTAQTAVAAMDRSIVFDPYGKRDRINWANGHKDRRPWQGKLVSIDDLLKRPRELLCPPKIRLVVWPSNIDDEQAMGKDFATVIQLAWYVGAGRTTIVGEELALYGRSCVPLINRIATGGGHAGLSLVAISQSMGRIPIDCRRNINLVVAGPQGEPSDFDDLRGRCGPDFTARVRSLQLGHAPQVWAIPGATRKA